MRLRLVQVLSAVVCLACGGEDPEPGPSDDHGDSAERATQLSPGATGSTQLDSASDVDVFAIEVRAGRIYHFFCRGGPAGYSSAYQLRVVRADGSQVRTSGVSVLTVALAGFRAERDERLFVHVQPGTGTEESRKLTYPAGYTYAFEDAGPDDHGDTRDTATALAVGTPVEGMLQLTDDVDVFALTLEGARDTRVSVTNAPERYGSFDLVLEDAAGETVGQVISHSAPVLELAALPAGTYRVHVKAGFAFGSTGLGSYVLAVTQLAP